MMGNVFLSLKSYTRKHVQLIIQIYIAITDLINNLFSHPRAEEAIAANPNRNCIRHYVLFGMHSRVNVHHSLIFLIKISSMIILGG